MKRTYSDYRDGQWWVWDVERLWRLAQRLPIKTVPLASITNFDEVCWFPPDGDKPTCRAVAAHAKRIYEADFTHPIILSAKGDLMDGMHRLAKAWILGMEEVQVVQFEEDPEPDQIGSSSRGGLTTACSGRAISKPLKLNRLCAPLMPGVRCSVF